jgi:hypothetical protein
LIICALATAELIPLKIRAALSNTRRTMDDGFMSLNYNGWAGCVKFRCRESPAQTFTADKP